MSLERRIKEIFNWQVKKEREYGELASSIIDAIEARMKESETNNFRELPYESRILTEGVGRCHISYWGQSNHHRVATVIEEGSLNERAERGITIISELERSKYPFIQYHEEIKNEGEISFYWNAADKDMAQDYRPRMWRYLESVKKWQPVTSSQI